MNIILIWFLWILRNSFVCFYILLLFRVCSYNTLKIKKNVRSLLLECKQQSSLAWQTSSIIRRDIRPWERTLSTVPCLNINQQQHI